MGPCQGRQCGPAVAHIIAIDQGTTSTRAMVFDQALAIVAAERVLRWVPPGTHEFEKFMTPEELAAVAHRAGLEVREAAGMVYTPPLPAPGRNGAVAGRWTLSGDDLAVNYIVYLSKPK